MGTSNRKRVNISLPPETFALLEAQAKAESMSPTAYAAKLVVDAVGGYVRPPHAPKASDDK